DNMLTHVNQLDQEYQCKLLEKDQPDATLLMWHFFDAALEATEPRLRRSVSLAGRAHIRKGHERFLDTLPSTVSNMEPCEIWKPLERTYRLGDVCGLIELTRKSLKHLACWKNLRTLFVHLKELRNSINMKTRTLMGEDMLPSEFWASSITMDKDKVKVEHVWCQLRMVFGDKCKKDISVHLDKWAPTPINNVNKKRKSQPDVTPASVPHHEERSRFKPSCSVQASTASEPIRQQRDREAEGTAKPTKLEESDASGDLGVINDLNCMDLSDSDSQMQDGLDELKFVVCHNNVDYLRRLKQMKVTVGPGRAITSDKRWFVALQRGQAQAFVYGNNTTSSTEAIGTVRIDLLMPQMKFGSLSVRNVALDPQCGSNIISASCLPQQGFRFLQSKRGDFLFFLNKSRRLMFATVALDDVYYLPSSAVRHRNVVCNINVVCNPEVIAKLMKEWYLRLVMSTKGH
ncbi:TPA: hypothetical protein N0F65_005471, partial [Lagenidium giganteum]